jgi:Na+/H+-translocating membrane pyrophosphatase
VTGGSTFLDFSDADLKASLMRAIRLTAILAVVLAVVLTVTIGWQSGILLLIGALISASGLWEWQRLIQAVNARLDQQQNPRPMGPVLVSFFLRLLVAGGLLYGSLKCFHGSVFALVAGLALAVVGLSIEAVRLVKA